LKHQTFVLCLFPCSVTSKMNKRSLKTRSLAQDLHSTPRSNTECTAINDMFTVVTWQQADWKVIGCDITRRNVTLSHNT
jgi:hypothetical protein